MLLVLHVEAAMMQLALLRWAPEVLRVAGLRQGPAVKCGLLQLTAQQCLGLRQVRWLLGL